MGTHFQQFAGGVMMAVETGELHKMEAVGKPVLEPEVAEADQKQEAPVDPVPDETTTSKKKTAAPE